MFTFYMGRDSAILSGDGAYFGFCIISQVRMCYRKIWKVERITGRQRSGAVISQRQKVLLGEGASANPRQAVDNRDKPSTCMIIYGS